jgi:hypothetical protein
MLSGCLLAPFKLIGFIFKAIWEGIKWCFRNGIKGFVVFGFCVLVVGFFLGQLHGSPAETNTATTQQGEPTIAQAPYIVRTNTQYFYTKEARQDGSDYILTPCWALVNNKWMKYETMRLPKVVKISKR